MLVVQCYTCGNDKEIPNKSYHDDKPYICSKECKSKDYLQSLSEWRLKTRGYPSGFNSIEQYEKYLERNKKVDKICVMCSTEFQGTTDQECCSPECTEKNRVIKIAKTKELKYGSAGYNNNKKSAETCLRKYGARNPGMVEEFKKKGEETCLKRYGARNISQSDEGKKRIGDALEKRYGVRSYFEKHDEIKKVFLKKYGVENPQQIKEVQEKALRTKQERYEMMGCVPSESSKKTCLEKYGSEYFLGSEQGNMSRENLMSRYGYTPEQVEEIMKSKDSVSDDYYKSQYGYDDETIRQIRSKRFDTTSWQWALGKANGDEKVASDIFMERQKSIKTKYACASKESMRVFEPLIAYMIEDLGIDKEDIYVGTEDSKEYFLADSENKCVYFYDLTIRSKKVIIEYNGIRFHPKSREEDPDKWDYDERKKVKAESEGFTVFTIWGDETPETNLSKMKEELQKCLQSTSSAK